MLVPSTVRTARSETGSLASTAAGTGGAADVTTAPAPAPSTACAVVTICPACTQTPDARPVSLPRMVRTATTLGASVATILWIAPLRALGVGVVDLSTVVSATPPATAATTVRPAASATQRPRRDARGRVVATND